MATKLHYCRTISLNQQRIRNRCHTRTHLLKIVYKLQSLFYHLQFNYFNSSFYRSLSIINIHLIIYYYCHNNYKNQHHHHQSDIEIQIISQTGSNVAILNDVIQQRRLKVISWFREQTISESFT